MVEKVSSGQFVRQSPLGKAAFVNDVIDSVNDYKARLLGEPTTGLGLKFPTDLVKVKNLTGDDRQRGDVVQLGDDLLDDKDFRRLWFECDLPADPIMRRYAILLVPLIEDEIGIAQISGCCLARINVGNVDHTHAMPADGADELVSCCGGPVELLSVPPDGTGSQEIAVRLAVALEIVYGKSFGAIAKSSTSGQMKVHSGPPGTGSTEISGLVITGIHNPWSAIPDAKLMGVQLVNGKFTTVAREC